MWGTRKSDEPGTATWEAAAVNPYVRQIGVVTLCESFQNEETKHTKQQLELRKAVEHPWRKKVEQNPCNPRDILSTAKLNLTDRKAIPQ
jgi:hypothetical protein